jgi:hypothetical protein
MGRIPKPVGQLHGHRKVPETTKIAAAPRWTDQDGNLVYGVVERTTIPCREAPEVIYAEVRLPHGIEFEED